MQTMKACVVRGVCALSAMVAHNARGDEMRAERGSKEVVKGEEENRANKES